MPVSAHRPGDHLLKGSVSSGNAIMECGVRAEEGDLKDGSFWKSGREIIGQQNATGDYH
jgi:hypothetical protein